MKDEKILQAIAPFSSTHMGIYRIYSLDFIRTPLKSNRVTYMTSIKLARGIIMDFRKIFDTIPEKFEKWRPRYCDELFADVVEHANIDSHKSVLVRKP